MAEFITESQGKEMFASKQKGNAGLTLGIIGTALGALAMNGKGFLGLGGNNCGASDYPTPYQVAQKECEDNIALTKAIYETRIVDKDEKFQLYTMLSDRINGLEKNQAIVSAQLPLMFQLANVTSERYADDKVFGLAQNQNAINAAMQAQICKKIDGTLGLPYNELITGVPTMPPLNYVITGCNGK